MSAYISFYIKIAVFEKLQFLTKKTYLPVIF